MCLCTLQVITIIFITLPSSSAGTSLRRVGAVVGNFFGVTEASQQGTADTIGWEEFTERRVEVSNVISYMHDCVLVIMTLSKQGRGIAYLGYHMF